MLTWKGFKGKDPFLGMTDNFVQFIEGVPIYNFNDPTSFDYEGQTIFFLYAKYADLPESLQTWATLMEVDKIKMKVELSYRTTFLDELESPYGKEKAYILATSIDMTIIELKAQSHKEWLDLPVTDNPVFQEYLNPVSYKFESLHSDTYPFGTVSIYEEPEFKAVFSFKEVQKNVPNCTNSEEQIYLFPNPNFGQINIKMIDKSAGEYFFDVYNIVGHKVWSRSLMLDAENSLMRFDLPSLEKGVYIYSIKNRDGAYLQSRRLVVVEP